MKTLYASFAAIALTGIALIGTSAHAQTPERGRIVGNGQTLPREIVPGKQPNQRAAEIAKWIVDKGGIRNRACGTEHKDEGYCITMFALKLTSGALLWVRWPDDNRYVTYCVTNPDVDRNVCYGFGSDSYFSAVYDRDAKEWTTVWNEKDSSTTQPTKPASNDSVEM